MSEQRINAEWQLTSKVVGLPTKENFTLKEIPVPVVNDGEILLETIYVSVDPYLRGRIMAHTLGEPLVSGTVARVIQSKNSAYAIGDVICAYLPWRKFNVTTGSDPNTQIRKVRADDKDIPASTALGVLGMPGATAYFGLLDVCKLKDGENVFVSGAAGAVGSLVGQIAKLHGCRVVGSAGGEDKCKHVVNDLGFDACIDYKKYKTAAEVKQQLAQAFPKGIDVYFDNVGGHVTEAVWELLNRFARVGICGQISMYNATEMPMVPAFLHTTIYRGVNIRGFLVHEFAAQFPKFYEEGAKWIKEGKIKYKETFTKGFETLPEAFIGLFNGANTGKMVVQV